MAYRPLVDIPVSMLDNSSTMLTGGVLKAYVTGTSDEATLYADENGTPAGVSVTLDARGEPTTIKRIWLSTSVTYKLVLEDGSNNVLWTADPVYGADSLAESSRFTSVGNIVRTTSAKLLEPVSVKDFGATGDGVADDTAEIQAAFDYLAANGGALEFPKGTYLVSGQLTLQRNDNADAKSWVIKGNGSTIQSTYNGEILVVGATSSTYFVEDGGTVIEDLIIRGAESVAASGGTDPVYNQTGLYLYCAGNVQLKNVQALRCRTGFRTHFAFPLKAIGCSGRGCWIGAHLDEASNLQDWDGLHTPDCRYGVLIRSSTTSFDSGKSNNITLKKWWAEGSVVGMVIDSGTGGSGNTRFRSINIIEPYIAGIDYDIIRMGIQYAFATPATRGSACSEFITDVRIIDGLWNHTYSATASAIVFDSSSRVGQCYVDVPIPSLDVDANSFVNSPSGGTVVTRGLPQTAEEGRTTTYIYNDSGSLVRKDNYNGTIQFSASQGVSFGNETLNAYDEGTFTPTIIGATSAGTATYSSQLGRYTRIGNRVFFELVLVWTGHTGTGSMRIAGLPVTPNASTISSVYFGVVDSVVLGSGNYLTGYVRDDAAQITLFTASLGTSSPTAPAVSAAGTIRCSGHYGV